MPRFHAPSLSPALVARMKASPVFANCDVQMGEGITDIVLARLLARLLGIPVPLECDAAIHAAIERSRSN